MGALLLALAKSIYQLMLHAHIKRRNCRYPMACIAPCKGIHARQS